MFTELHVKKHSDERQERSELQDADNFLFFVEALACDKTDANWLTSGGGMAVRGGTAFPCGATTGQQYSSCNGNDTDSSSSADRFVSFSASPSSGQSLGVGCTSPVDFNDNSVQAPSQFSPHCFDVKLGKSERRYTCATCHKEFKRRSSLSTHKLIHANIKPFQCPTCHKEFLRRSDLKKHVLMHTGQKPHRCMECGKEFSQSSNMLTHMRRHSGVRPFACQICGHAFFRKVDVRRHQYRHLREKSLSSTSSVD